MQTFDISIWCHHKWQAELLRASLARLLGAGLHLQDPLQVAGKSWLLRGYLEVTAGEMEVTLGVAPVAEKGL
ncbi:hypothetical protein A9Q02_21365 [Candidatus Chloroploca asiatica]|uniref:Uncharacterized protein n=1 Tax=Candidatus Chloroploca asiatica TaxID=1506545 RepID=A0A2H3LE84_9CHLR|nr:hypothetical protein A9Q02_21365 [Candidatus Chloroploca asiatica]